MDTCRIDWQNFSPAQWNDYLCRVKRPSLLQSYSYGITLCRLYHQNLRQGLIFINGHEAGIVQFQEASILKNTLHALMFDRGPLWFEGYGSTDHQKAFFDEFARLFPKRLGRWRRILPEVPVNDDMRHFFKENNYKCLASPGYQTIWLDLSPEESDLRAALKQKWRNMLNKAEKQDISVEWDDEGQFLSWMLTKYKADKEHKGYEGPSLKVLAPLAKNFRNNQGLLIGRAILEGQPIAAVMILCHGSSATYQVGWSSDKGRKSAAHNLLLWETIRILKDKDIRYFDLGGINDTSAEGVKKFKEGLGGETVTYLGHYV